MLKEITFPVGSRKSNTIIKYTNNVPENKYQSKYDQNCILV